MSTDMYAGYTIPTWHVLDRRTGEFLWAAVYGSNVDLALMRGDTRHLTRDEVAHNRLSGEVIYR